MDSKKANISQIRKYLNGQLDATAMHKLEREALDDPFLMDALEGYETTGKDQQANLAQLSDSLQQRTAEKKGRVIAWKVWSIAASIIVVLTIGGLWLRNTPPVAIRTPDIALENKAQKALKDTVTLQKAKASVSPALVIAQNIKKPPVLKHAAKSSYQQELSANDHPVAVGSAAEVIANTPPVANAAVVPEGDKNASPLNEAVVMNYTQNKKVVADTVNLGYAAATSPITYGSSTSGNIGAVSTAKSSPKFKQTNTIALPGKVDGLMVEPSKESRSQGDIARFTGIIISRNDGMPLIGAAIRVKGTNRSTVTDTKGYFALPAASPGDKSTLDIVSIGYQPVQVSAKAGDSVKVALKPDGNSLSEVVVTSKKNSEDEPVYEAAHPEKGWSDFKKYLQINASLPDGTTGTVSVTFTVDADGSLSDMKIKKSLNTMADQKAMELIKTGPDWMSNSSHKPEIVTVKVKFQKQK